MGFGGRFGMFVVSAVLLYLALRAHKAQRNPRAAKYAGVVIAFFAGCAFLAAIWGTWIASTAAAYPYFAAAALVACVGILGIDLGMDGRPDKAAFWAMFFIASCIAFGWQSLPYVTQQVSDGLSQVSNRMGSGQ